ncbi:MAG TPA: hypothetical protein VGL91_23945 [Acidobacteriota bacterium]|jgi:hypothetical protein
MNILTSLEPLIRESNARGEPHAKLFQHVAPEAKASFDDHFRAVCAEQQSAARQQQKLAELLRPGQAPLQAKDEVYREVLQDFVERSKEPLRPLDRAGDRPGARIAQAAALQPVQDLIWTGFHIIRGDAALDVFGPPYSDTWTSSPGAAAAALDGSFHINLVASGTGSGIGVWAMAGSAVWVQFTPRISPGWAQVRPYTPFDYRWDAFLNAQSYGAFGIYVLSWDLAGRDQRIEQKYYYYFWKDIAYGWDADDHNPSYYVGGPTPVDQPPGKGWDGGFGYPPDRQAPYFPVWPNRIYKAAVWSFGGTWVGHYGFAVAQIVGAAPFVVVGYQLIFP